MLGIAYGEGELVKKNDLRALAWFRESVRNGNPVSYLNAGDLLAEGSDQVPQNRLFAFMNYLGAYTHGALFLQEKMEKLTKDLKEIEGYELPEVKYVDQDKF